MAKMVRDNSTDDIEKIIERAISVLCCNDENCNDFNSGKQVIIECLIAAWENGFRDGFEQAKKEGEK